MRILHLLKSDKFSGAENVALTIMNLFPKEEMIYASPDGPIRKVVEDAGQQFYALHSSNVSSVKAAIADLKPDIIHAHDFSMATNAAFAAGNIPVFAHLHNNPPWLGKIHPKSVMFAFALSRIRHVISVSESVQQEYLFGNLMNEKITVLENFVDVERVQKLAQTPCRCKTTDLVFLGRLTQPKQPIVFCEIVNQVQKKLPKITARMIGDGELKEDVKSYIERNDLNGTIELVGFQANPYPYLQHGKIMVMPSAWEGFGLAAVEALSLGIPVLCSGVGGLKSIIDASCGSICLQTQKYVDSILQLLSAETDWDQINRNCRTRAKKFADKDHYKETLQKIYNGVQG